MGASLLWNRAKFLPVTQNTMPSREVVQNQPYWSNRAVVFKGEDYPVLAILSAMTQTLPCLFLAEGETKAHLTGNQNVTNT